MRFLNWLKGEQRSEVAPTGKVIDMTRTFWGHNISFSKAPTHDDYSWKAAIWYGNGVKVGDEIIWHSAEGRVVRSLISKCEWTGNVWDMYFIEGRVFKFGEHDV